jgi:ferritin-like metal-binding protein YciE
MAQDTRDILITGLKNAYALEGQAIEILERQAERLVDYPELQARIRQHLEESREQQGIVQRCLERYDSSGSGFKESVLKMVGNLQAMVHGAAGDEVLKNSFASYAFEHYEIAAYKSLIAMAEAVGDQETASACRGILRQEEEMARWLDQHLPSVTQQYIERARVSTAEAKR